MTAQGPGGQATSALGGLRVADFSRVLAGPFATMLMGDLGAEVIKVERPGTGDDTRAWKPPQDEQGVSTYFLGVNRNKESLAVDLRTPQGQREARSLMATSDVVVENFRVGLMDELGLGYNEISELNPGVIYCSITGFGSGEGAALPGYDLLVQAVGGLMSITGAREGGPQKVGVAMVDILAGLFATVGILAALRHREATGQGQRVEINLLSSLLAALANQASAYTAAGVVPGRMGNDHPSIAPYSAYRAADGDLVIAVGNDRQFGQLCSELGLDQLVEDDRYATNESRVRNRDSLRAELEPALGRHPVEHWIDRLAEARVPAGRVNDMEGAFALAERLGLAPIVETARADGTVVRTTANPIGLGATPPTYRKAPPVDPGLND